MSFPILPFFSDAECQRWSRVRGWLLPEAAECLHRHIGLAPEGGRFVEIGSFAGKSTLCLLRALSKRMGTDGELPFTAIDLRFQPDFEDNLSGFGFAGRIETIAAPSLDAIKFWHAPIALLYIDGHHDKGYALADLLLWDAYLMEGGILALDDTAGFMVGPNLQIQVAVRTGAYELLEERGGISFLRKTKSILLIHEVPISPGALMARLHAISADVGAMDPAFRFPRLPHQPMPVSEWIDRALHSSLVELFQTARRKIRSRLGGRSNGSAGAGDPLPPVLRPARDELKRLEEMLPVRPDLQPTFDYLRACFELRKQDWKTAADLLGRLLEGGGSEPLYHYSLPVAVMAKLRLAQCLAMSGAPDQARTRFAELAADGGVPQEIRELCKDAGEHGYSVPAPTGNPLLREYNLALYRYKRPVFGPGEPAP